MKARIVFFLLVALYNLYGQEQTPPLPVPPPGPMIQLRAPDFSCWKITQSPSQDSSSGAGSDATGSPGTGGSNVKKSKSVVVTITKTAAILVQETTATDGQTWKTWYPNTSVGILVWPDGKSVMTGMIENGAQTRSSSIFYSDMSKSDFPDFTWIQASSYGGTQSYKEKRCLVFYGKVLQSGALSPVPFQGHPPAPADDLVTAYVDAKTRLPVAIQIAKEDIKSYEFQPPPSAMLVLPDIVQKALEDRKKSVVSMTPHVVRPY